MIGQTLLWAPEPTLPLRKRVTVERITAAEARHALVTWHYLHRVRTGRQLNYAVAIDGVVDGVITYAYPACSKSIDGVIPGEVLEFARLYLHSNVPHTASCAVGQTLRRIRRDWQQAWPDAPPIRMVVSWSDRTRHVGTIYKAANFQWLKVSKGDHRSAVRKPCPSRYGLRKLHPTLGNDKDCWIYRWPGDRPNTGRTFSAQE